MDRIIFYLQNLLTRVLTTIFLVAGALIISAALGYNPLETQAQASTPIEMAAYTTERSENAQEQDGLPRKELIENSREQINQRAKDLRKKLDLGQTLSPAGQEVKERVPGRTQETIEDVRRAANDS